MYLISVIVSTYNWPEALNLCLVSLLAQQDTRFEIIIADDGSDERTKLLIDDYINNSKLSILHVYQEDNGFRLSAIRNKAVVMSNGDYLVFIDGDCVVKPSFIKNHRKLMTINHFVAGNRVLLEERFTNTIFNKKIYLHNKKFLYFFTLWVQRKINRLIPLIRFPLGNLRNCQAKKWNKVVGCNIGVYKKDFFTVNGFDESFSGWGYEDSDFAIRLINSGVLRKEGRFAVPVLHLWHKQNSRNNENVNYQRMINRSKNRKFIYAEQGVSQYIK